jgi:hypothetical protein
VSFPSENLSRASYPTDVAIDAASSLRVSLDFRVLVVAALAPYGFGAPAMTSAPLRAGLRGLRIHDPAYRRNPHVTPPLMPFASRSESDPRALTPLIRSPRTGFVLAMSSSLGVS